MVVREGYKQTEVGVIPEEWKVVSIKKSAPLQRGFDLPYRFIKKGQYPIVYSNGILKSHAHFMVKGAGVVTGRSGTIGKVHYVEDDFWPHNTTLWVTDFFDNEPKYIYYLFKSLQLERFATGTGVPTLNRNDVHDSLISIPPKPEQKAITKALSDVDALIASLEQLITKKQLIKQGAMRELLTGKKRLPGFEVKKGYKQTEIGEIPEDWEAYEMSQVLDSMQLGGNYTNNEQETSNPLIKMGNLGRGNIKLDKLEFIPSSIKPLERDRLKKGNVLFNTRNTLDLVGKVAIWNNELTRAYFNSNILRMKFKNKYISSNRYMNYLFNTSRMIQELRNIAIGTTSVAAIYSRDLTKIKLYLPENTEQKAIATILSDMDTEIEALRIKLVKTKQLKEGMMHELLTGRIRLI